MKAITRSSLILLNKGSQSAKLILFTRHLHLMLKSGLTISDSLAKLSQQEKNYLWHSVLTDMQKKINKGSTLSDAMDENPELFSSFYANLVRVGEESGRTVDVLSYLLGYLEKQRSLRRTIVAALTYPLIVLIVAFALSVFLGLFILPKLMSFFTAFGTELPLATRILMSIAQFMGNYGLQFFLLLGASVVLIMALIQTNFFKPTWQKFQLRLPIIGHLILANSLAQLNYDLHLLLQSGIPIIAALGIAKNATTLTVIQSALKEVEKSLNRGSSLSSAFKNFPQVFPDTYVSLIAVGEQTGNLVSTTQFVAEYFEDEVEQSAKSLGSILEPLLLVGVSLIVGAIALAIISPIYQLTGALRP